MVSTNEIIAETAVINTETEINAITEDEFEKATKLFQSGKKNLFLNKYDESVNNIDEACKAYVTKYGEMDAQCAEVYFFYGRALLELARVESTVLGNALTGVPEDTSPIDDSRYGNPEDVAAEEKDEIAEKVMDALCSTDEEIKNDEEAKNAAEKCEEQKTETTTTAETIETKKEEVVAEPKPVVEGEKKIDENVAEPKEGAEEDCEEEGEDEEDDEEEIGDDEKAKEDDDAEDISNLQRSWEMFELAKVIYEKNFNDDLLFKKKRIAECFLKLGEISIEQEANEQAIVDITESIRLQEEIKDTERDERMLAESYYQLGLARQTNIQFAEATDSYQKSINIVQLKMEKLRGKLLQIGEGVDADLEKNTINDEIAELETLLPEMLSKLEEVTEQGQQSLNAIKEARECLANTSETNKFNAPSTNGADIKDITSLVKSKRKNENCDETSVKKTRLSSENGNAENIENGEENNHIEIDNNKPINDENKENKMEETTETPAAKIAETIEQIEQPIEAEPIASA